MTMGYHPWQSIKGASESDAVSGYGNGLAAGNISQYGGGRGLEAEKKEEIDR